MKRYLPILSLLFIPFISYAQQTITGLVTPESVVAYKGGYFVSDMGPKLDATAKDGDGAICFINGKGKVESLKYFDDTLNAPKGLDIIGDVIYVADIDHLKGYNITTRKKVFDLNMEGKAILLNDLSRVDDSLLVITDSFKSHVLLVNVHTASWHILKGEIVVPNGILYNAHNDEVYVCSMGANLDGNGKLYAKKLHDDNAAFELVEGTPTGLFDGIIQLDDHRLLLSDWITIKDPVKGNLYVYDIDKKQYTLLAAERAPADIALDVKQHTLLIPQMLDNRLAIIPLKKLGL
jgi:DNA-binding beta-propeller fold protein YncE